jgi:hypothetical protein
MLPGRRAFLTLLLSLAALAPQGEVRAQVTEEPDSLRRKYHLPVPTPEQAAGVVVRPNAAFSPGPAAYRTEPFFLVYAGAAYTPETRYIKGKHDGNAIVGAAFGDPVRWAAIQADLALYSTVRSGFFNRMGLGLEVYRYLPGGLILSLGWENILQRGESDIGDSQYGVLSRWFQLREPGSWLSHLGLSAGVGNGRFVSEDDWIAESTNRLNLFGSMSLQVARPLAFIADWQGDDLTLGLGLIPFQERGLIITPALYDVTGTVRSSMGFMISALYAHRVR